jgi:hypothetical protein
MPIGYHRDVCIASPTAARTLPEPSPRSAQERSIVRRRRHSTAGRIFTCRSQANGLPDVTMTTFGVRGTDNGE